METIDRMDGVLSMSYRITYLNRCEFTISWLFRTIYIDFGVESFFLQNFSKTSSVTESWNVQSLVNHTWYCIQPKPSNETVDNWYTVPVHKIGNLWVYYIQTLHPNFIEWLYTSNWPLKVPFQRRVTNRVSPTLWEKKGSRLPHRKKFYTLWAL